MYGRFENILYTKINTLDKWQTVIPMLYSPNNLVRSVVGTM